MDPNTGFGDRTLNADAFTTPKTYTPPRGYALSGKIMLSAIIVLFSIVLLVVFLHLYVRWYLLRLAARRRRRPLVFAAAAAQTLSHGLDPTALESLPVLVYSPQPKIDEISPDCAVCLNEFEEGEKLRSLPRCGHRFHIECIDMWFYSHATCPLCRSAVEPVHADVGGSEPSDLCSCCMMEEGMGSSSSGSRVENNLRVNVSRGVDEEVVSPAAFKSPGGRIRSIRRMLSREGSFYRGGGAAAAQLVDLEAATSTVPPHEATSPPI